MSSTLSSSTAQSDKTGFARTVKPITLRSSGVFDDFSRKPYHASSIFFPASESLRLKNEVTAFCNGLSDASRWERSAFSQAISRRWTRRPNSSRLPWPRELPTTERTKMTAKDTRRKLISRRATHMIFVQYFLMIGMEGIVDAASLPPIWYQTEAVKLLPM